MVQCQLISPVKNVNDSYNSPSNTQKTGKKTGENQENTVSERDSAWGLLTEFTQSESLRKHALAVEACMRAYARKLGADEDQWAVTGLLHDFDYEKYPTPEEHPFIGSKILRERGYPEEVIRAILS